MRKISVKTSNQYDVLVGSHFLDKVGSIFSEYGISGKICIITDKKVASLYLEKVKISLTKANFTIIEYIVEGGEQSKSGAQYLEICEFLAQNHISRSDVLVALGGGVVGDLTGFVSATYLRGVKFVQIPTTLLAFADSSVGGKTAINLESGKNLVGAFYQPQLVICSVDCANTLSKEDYASGMAEIIKYGFIFDKELLDLIEQGMEANAEEIIARCIDLKRIVVEQDEFDNGCRMLLNFGHTLGHAIEKSTGFAVMHGQAVAIGMNLITECAIRNGMSEKSVKERLVALCEKYSLPTSTDKSISELVEITKIDKKRKGDEINVIICTTQGKSVIKKFTLAQWKEFCNI